MTWTDGHLDLAYLHLTNRDLREPCADRRHACISLPDLREGGVDLAFGTIFIEPDPDDPDDPCGYPAGDVDAASQAGRAQLDLYETLEREGELRMVRTRADLDADGPRPGIVLLMEGADAIRDHDEVAWWHDKGLRLVGLTWWRGTRYAGGNGTHGPLTPAGVDLVKALDEAGIIHDASHLSDESLDGVLKHATGRIVATHSNCRALMDGVDQRHLRDDQIVEIGRRDGVIGLNLYTKFLVTEGRAGLDDCVAHVQRIVDLMGHRRGVALGTDADGGFGPESLPPDLDHPTKYDALSRALRDAGWSDEDVAGFEHGNWRRILEESLPER